MRGRGGDPSRVVDYNRFAGQYGNQFSSRQPAQTTPISAAPASPRVGTGAVATAVSSFPSWATATPSSVAPSSPLTAPSSSIVGDTTSAINVQPSTPQMNAMTGIQGESTKVPRLNTRA